MIYNIILPPQVSSFLTELEKFQNTEQDEVELRIKNVNADMFNKILRYLDTVNTFQKETTKDTSRIYSKDSIRVIDDGKTKKYIKKQVEKDSHFSMIHSYKTTIDYKLSHSKEIPIKPFETRETREQSLERNRDRTSFIAANKYRIDLTIINRSSYEVEIEFIDLKIIKKSLKEALGYIFPFNHTLISSANNSRLENVFNFLKSYQEIKPINISEKHFSGLEINNESQYSVTNKLDGTKYYLCYVRQNMNTLLYLVNVNDLIILYYNTKENTTENETCIFEVEILEEKIIEIYAFDTVFYNNKSLGLHPDRIKIANDFREKINAMRKNKLIELDFMFQTKTFLSGKRFVDNIKNALKLLEEQFKTIENIEKMNDGLIFQPIFANKNPLKWKFVNKVSIDFLYANGKLYSYNKITRQNEEFTDANGNKYKLNNTSFSIPNNSIIECVFENGKFVFHRYRYDKIFPNELTVTARDTFKDMIEPFHLSKIYDYFKSSLKDTNNEFFEQYVKSKNVLNNILEYGSKARECVIKEIKKSMFEKMDFGKNQIVNHFENLIRSKLNIFVNVMSFKDKNFTDGVLEIIGKHKDKQKIIFQIADESINSSYKAYIEGLSNKIEPYYYKRKINENDMKIIKLLITV
jgi:hypothetical protein